MVRTVVGISLQMNNTRTHADDCLNQSFNYQTKMDDGKGESNFLGFAQLYGQTSSAQGSWVVPKAWLTRQLMNRINLLLFRHTLNECMHRTFIIANDFYFFHFVP